MTDQSKIFCAIDTADLDYACELVAQIAPVTGGIKLGLEFFNNFGPQGIDRVLKSCPQAQLFIDLKFHDIPNTVAGAVRGICSNFAPAYLNVHASGGMEMMAAAKEACGADTKLLAVTILTSLDASAIAEIGYGNTDVGAQVEQLARLAQKSGLDGVVCSAHEISRLRNVCGDDFTLMVPGIRPVGSAQGDQKRVMTPIDALNAGATHLVIGRPITGATDPAKAAAEILKGL
ncbi:MAG: orotidine-5'-phosphate decarboxylase [Zetaproteobacteria bacterium]|nr:MAG: orotidine-5'-phosphate decarboxylase [Zetaproteobacteria bacterium]